MTYKAFVSSTFADLRRHRMAVIDSLRKAGFFVDPMEDWTAARDEPKVFSQDRIADCDLCVLLVGFRRGHVPRGEHLSITQLEYEAAKRRGIDVLVFMAHENSVRLGEFDESNEDPEIGRWRNELQETHGVGFFDDDPGSIEIAPALTRWVIERERAFGPQGIPRPKKISWTPKTVRIASRCGLLETSKEQPDFSKEVAQSLRINGRDWVRGMPLQGSDRVLSDWAEYSTMSLVAATNPDVVVAPELQDYAYAECQQQLIGCLLQLAVDARVMEEDGELLSVADDLSEEMSESFEHLDSLGYLEEAGGNPKTAAVLAFIEMVRARLALEAPDKVDFAEAIATLILSSFGFWEGPES